MASKRKRTIMRAALTASTSKYTLGGRLRTKPRTAPITLAKLRPVARGGTRGTELP